MTGVVEIWGTQRPVGAVAVRGPRAIASVCARCLVVLVVVNVGVAVAWGATQGTSGVPVALYFFALAIPVALVTIAVVGWPAGLLTAELLRREPREWVHVLVFALVGAGLCLLLAMHMWHMNTWSVMSVLWALAEGAAGAGGGRWWAGHARRRATRVALAAQEALRPFPPVPAYGVAAPAPAAPAPENGGPRAPGGATEWEPPRAG
ncbi:hypothetical protein [Cellulomonas sp.]|uniref:hypothetical protein n=1 Tax=Cellulomonas sp. TaxID=40001 RepID=UPI001B07B67C|nr:hypothetical protein [Cellulomonas sp.]MBO9556528.1 hypothetical protein [Cellulomonas sp.]